MTPVFWFLALLAVIALWLVISFAFIPLGRVILKGVRRFLNIINYEETINEEKEEDET